MQQTFAGRLMKNEKKCTRNLYIDENLCTKLMYEK